MLDSRAEARTCVSWAEAETDPDMRTILMGMALGWLTLANEFEAVTTAPAQSPDEPD
jgi:hypothetical protein